MIVYVPKSMFDLIQHNMKTYSPELTTDKEILFLGPYGQYRIIGIPDEDLTERKPEIVLRYKDNTLNADTVTTSG